MLCFALPMRAGRAARPCKPMEKMGNNYDIHDIYGGAFGLSVALLKERGAKNGNEYRADQQLTICPAAYPFSRSVWRREVARGANEVPPDRSWLGLVVP